MSVEEERERERERVREGDRETEMIEIAALMYAKSHQMKLTHHVFWSLYVVKILRRSET
jgi:hypothetical protein